MTGETTGRWALPLLAAGQAQKEMTHNEALARLDLLVQPAVLAVGVDVPPGDPAMGACWIVGATPVGDWAGQPRALAGWTPGGWRFVAPAPGMRAWNRENGREAVFRDGEWREGALNVAPQPAIATPAGGATGDAEARAAIAAILAALRSHGLIAA